MAGAGGWYYAQQKNNANIAVDSTRQSLLKAEHVETVASEEIIVLPQNGEININKSRSNNNQLATSQSRLENVNVKQLVHSARVELSSSN